MKSKEKGEREMKRVILPVFATALALMTGCAVKSPPPKPNRNLAEIKTQSIAKT